MELRDRTLDFICIERKSPRERVEITKPGDIESSEVRSGECS